LFVFSLIFLSTYNGIFSALTMVNIVSLTVFFTIACAVTGTIFYYKKKLYDKNINIFMGIGMLIGGFIGSLSVNALSNEMIQLFFFILSLIAAVSVFLSESRFLFQVDLSYYWLILIGGVLGIIGGIFG